MPSARFPIPLETNQKGISEQNDKNTYRRKDVSKWAETFENERSSQHGVEILHFR